MCKKTPVFSGHADRSIVHPLFPTPGKMLKIQKANLGISKRAVNGIYSEEFRRRAKQKSRALFGLVDLKIHDVLHQGAVLALDEGLQRLDA